MFWASFWACGFFVTIAISFTFPLWVSVNILGEPDNQAIISSYIGIILTATLFIAIGLCISSLTKNQIIAFIGSMMICFVYLLSGTNVLLDFFNQSIPMMAEVISSMSILWHFKFFMQGTIELKSLAFFGVSIGFWLFLNYLIVTYKRA